MTTEGTNSELKGRGENTLQQYHKITSRNRGKDKTNYMGRVVKTQLKELYHNTCQRIWQKQNYLRWPNDRVRSKLIYINIGDRYFRFMMDETLSRGRPWDLLRRGPYRTRKDWCMVIILLRELNLKCRGGNKQVLREVRNIKLSFRWKRR